MITNTKINKYLDRFGRYSLRLSEVVRQAYKEVNIRRETPESKLINIIFDKNTKRV